MSTKKNEVAKTFAQWTDTHWSVKFINNIQNITQYSDPFGTDTSSIPFTEDLLNQLVEKGKAMKPFKIYLKEGYAFIHGSASDKGVEVDFSKVYTDNLQWFAHVYGTPKADVNFTLNNDYYPGYVKCKTIVVNADSKYYETKFQDYSWGKKIYISPSGGPILQTGALLAWYQAECVSIKEGYIMPTADQIQVEPESMRQFLEFEYDFGSQEKVYNIYMYNRWDYDAAKYDQETSDTIITFPKPEATFYQVDVNKVSGTTITNGPVTQRVDIGKDMQSVSVKVDDTNRMGFDPEVRPTKEGVTFNVDTLQSAPYKYGWVSGAPLRDVSIDIPAPVEFSNTSITLGANLNVGSGKINQWSVKGKKIMEVVINCADGYEFIQNSDAVTDFTPYLNKIVVTPESEKTNIKFIITEGQLHITGTISNDISITLPEPVKKTYTVTVELGENIVRESGGELIQEVIIGQPMNQIILKVDDTKVIGSFYANTHNGSKDGVNMAVDTSGEKPYTKLTIGGIPTNNTTVNIAPPSLGYLVRITGGANTTHVSGSLRQYVNAGESIETVIFRCDEGYWFGKYSGGSNNSMSIKLNADKTELTLSGRPAGMSGFGDYDVRLQDAVKKPVTLTVNLPSDGSVKVKAGEENRLNQSIDPGEYIDGITLTPATNYYMDQEWRKQIQVAPVNDHIMVMTTDSETYISGTIVEDTVITVPSAIEKNVNGGEYMLTVDSIGSNLFGIAGFRSNECRGPATSSVDKNVTFGSITPGNYFGKKIIGCYISGSDGPELSVVSRITGNCYMVLELENKDHTGIAGSVMCGMTFKTLDISSSLGQEGSIDQDTLYFSSEDRNGTIFSHYMKLLAERGKTIPVIIAPMQRRGVLIHSDTFGGLTSYEGRWWTEWQLSNVSTGAVIKYIRNILTETGPKNIVLYTDETSNNSYFTNIPYGLSERFTIQFNDTKKIPMIWNYNDSKKGYYADLDYDMFCIDIGEDSYNNMSKPCTVRYWSRPYWYTLSLPATGVVNGDPVKLTLTCYGDVDMFNPNEAAIGISPGLISSLQVHTVTPFTSVSSNTYEATIKFTGTRDYTFSEDIVYVMHLDEVATVGIQLLYSGSV